MIKNTRGTHLFPCPLHSRKQASYHSKSHQAGTTSTTIVTYTDGLLDLSLFFE